jgi:hypothetical protein
VAAIDPWDGDLETITAALVAGAAGHRTGVIRATADNGWRADFSATRRSVTVLLAPAPGAPPPPAPGDYQLALIYGLDYQAVDDAPPPRSFAKTLSLREGFRWDEESLREIALEGLGLLRHALGASAITTDDQTRAGIAARAPRIGRRKR